MNKTNNKTNKKAKQTVRCATCLHAQLHRYGNDPLLAFCHKKPQSYNVRFPFEVEVANVLRVCEEYTLDLKEKEVEQRNGRYSV